MSRTPRCFTFVVGPIVILAVAMASAPAALAHEGHDHGAQAATPRSTNAPSRLADGSIFLPKPSQRQLAVRTVVTARENASRAIELPGIVIADPNAEARVQGTVAGRVEPGPRGLPTVGQSVARGQVLATLRPVVDPLERTARAAQLAQLRAERDLAGKRAARLRDLADTVPRKEIDAVESDIASLEARIAALASGVVAAESLVAPVTGVVARTNVVAGQLVDARAVLFEIVDPTRLRIEATGYEPGLAARVRSAALAVDGRPVALAFLGAGRVLKEQAVPLLFAAKDGALGALAVGQVVAVTVRTDAVAAGAPVPAVAVVRSAANEPIVWVKTEPERFVPQRVRVESLDAARVLVTDGLAGGERVVTDGAPLLNQVR
jgi:biotin carboxyl carrier protein